MRFIIGIKPTVLSGRGTTNAARARFRDSFYGCWCSSTEFGTAYVNGIRMNDKRTHVYAYNIEVFKRGKHRNNKHFNVYRYEFPIEMFKLLNVEIKQGARTFKIVPKRK